MDENASKIPGVERAAILLLSLGEGPAAEVLKHMAPKEVQKIGTAMAALTNVSRDQVGAVLENFTKALDKQTAIGVGSDEYIRKMLVQALGQDKASGVIDRILLGGSSKGLEALKWMDPRAVAELIRLEHPQIIAIILSYLDSDQAADIIVHLPERVRIDVIQRIATLDGIQPSAMHELNEIMEKQFSGQNTSNVKSSGVGGLKAAANILNLTEASKQAQIIAGIKEGDEKLAQNVEDLMFVFEDLVEIDDRGIQALLREISSDSLIIALKGADEAMKDKIFKNMSKRAAEMLRDDLDVRPPVRLSEVETAQKEILGVARRLSESGEISLGGKGGEQYV
ncbi:MAG TPA: flagellar motor switch protein FliG [Acidiferrobacterales bacterium]|nr:flagellar motor switch protein FliG [Acidiferrobacterales bacterium]